MANTRPPSTTLAWLKKRIWIQVAFLFAWLDPLRLRLHGFCSPVFQCYACPLATFACPIGVIANFSALHIFPFSAVGTLLFAGGLIGAFICGWVCPFGFLQDLFSKIPTPRIELPRKALYLRYVVLLALVIVIPFVWGESHPLFICRVCPAGGVGAALPRMIESAIMGNPLITPADAADLPSTTSDVSPPVAETVISRPGTVKLIIVGAFFAAMLFIHRPWCALLCPLGALYGLTNKFSALFLRSSSHKCTKCGWCRKLCKYGVEPDRVANDLRCIRCLECTRCGVLTVSTLFSRRGSEPKGVQ
jgi:polyferredoxin